MFFPVIMKPDNATPGFPNDVCSKKISLDGSILIPISDTLVFSGLL